MAKTIYYSATSLNGFIADKNNSLDWLFQFGGGDEVAEISSYKELIANTGAICMGSTTYQWMLDNHMAQGNAWPYQVPTWVFTTRKLKGIDGVDIRFVQGDVTPIHAEMIKAAAGKNIWIVGGGELAAKFYDAKLLNEVVWQMAPLTLDGGAPLFPRRIHPPMKLLKTDIIGGTMVEVKYEVRY
ncbi:dihydrofolate reductase family protein [Bdellovibrio sp. NC01]|uniref:dihydrofolate reductase family protein n=1 Tax=Bdellovibrio sp. NC01 TaxID=2220073 RepID=UPI001159CE34|nr:dihydrofolate reductase family protein [Bdellovibrio sp. NC01]QDK36377.1 dihydrofolate reductase [Bdellovibrio sp. NC01]